MAVQALMGPARQAQLTKGRGAEGLESATVHKSLQLSVQSCRSELHKHHYQGGLRVCQAAMAC